jgi:hypothetical protein
MTEPKFPTAGPDDADEVTLALTTANSLWANGETEEALRLLKKAVEGAEEADDPMRSVELARAAADLKTAVDKKQKADSEKAEQVNEDQSAAADGFQQKDAEKVKLDESSRPKLSKPPPPPPKTRLDTPMAKSQNGKSHAHKGENGRSNIAVSSAAQVGPGEENHEGAVLTQAIRVGIKRSVRDDELLVARLVEDGDVPAGYQEALVVLLDPDKDILDKLS